MITENINTILDALTASELHLKWQRNATTKTYHLYFERLGMGREDRLFKIWQIPGQKGYGLLSGCTCVRLDEAKSTAIVAVKREVKEALLRVNAALLNKEPLTLSLFHYNAIHTILNKWLKQVFAQTQEKHLAPIPVRRIRAESNRYGNAVAAFDTERSMFSLLNFGIHYQWTSSTQRKVNLETLALNFVCDSHVGGRNDRFGEQGYMTMPLSDLSDDSLNKALSDCFERLCSFVHNKENPELNIEKPICTTASYRQPY